MSLKEDIAPYFTSQSLFTRVMKDFHFRKEQQELAAAVANTIDYKEQLVAEAGTGTGKTFAYLIPAFLSQKKTVISTGTKNLQDQLFFGDLPLLQKALKRPLKIALLKGRANYLCRYRVALNAETSTFLTPDISHVFSLIREALPTLKRGEINELSMVPEDSMVWPYVTSTAENCLGKECDFYESCFLAKARKEALDADMIVINHHLFFADSQLKEDGFAEILPEAETIIFDEAHQLPNVASHFFGIRLSSRQLQTLLRDVVACHQQQANDMVKLKEACEALDFAIISLQTGLKEKPNKLAYADALNDTRFVENINFLTQALKKLEQQLDAASIRDKELAACFKRTIAFSQALQLLTKSDENNYIQWIETFSRSFCFHATPMSVATEFSALLSIERSYVFTSATLSMDSSFIHFIDSLGLQSVNTLQLDSPFDYQKQALLYLPRGMPAVKDKSFISTLVERALPLIHALDGRTLFLFTSYAALNEAVDYLTMYTDYALLVQGCKAKQQLLAEFKKVDKTILLATNSFWEGVDVKGQALSLVVIDKLPFESPFDPTIKARLQNLKKQGKQPFYCYQLPKAVIALKQGVGRLIRDAKDTGVMIIGDTRLYATTYSKHFLKSLPNMKKTRNEQEVLTFLQTMKQKSASLS